MGIPTLVLFFFHLKTYERLQCTNHCCLPITFSQREWQIINDVYALFGIFTQAALHSISVYGNTAGVTVRCGNFITDMTGV